MSTVALEINPAKTRALTAAEKSDQAVAANEYFGTSTDSYSCVWFFDGTNAVMAGVSTPDDTSQVAVQKGQALRSALSSLPMFKGKKFVIHKMDLAPGTFYPRISRCGSIPNYDELSITIMSSLNQIRTLIGMLDKIVQTVHPTKSNLKCFGTEIRNLIILTCTECEAQWRGVLKANGIVKDRSCTTDYAKLLSAMRLDEYKIKLRHFPWLDGHAPYAGWVVARATKSLDWYDDYNAIKHDRENSFDRATLRTAIRAISALWIMVAAQYGNRALSEFDDLSRYFQFERIPLWRYSEIYTSGHGTGLPACTPTKFPF